MLLNVSNSHWYPGHKIRFLVTLGILRIFDTVMHAHCGNTDAVSAKLSLALPAVTSNTVAQICISDAVRQLTLGPGLREDCVCPCVYAGG